MYIYIYIYIHIYIYIYIYIYNYYYSCYYYNHLFEKTACNVKLFAQKGVFKFPHNYTSVGYKLIKWQKITATI